MNLLIGLTWEKSLTFQGNLLSYKNLKVRILFKQIEQPSNQQTYDNLNSLPGRYHHNPKISLRSSVIGSPTTNRSYFFREELKDLKSFSPSKAPAKIQLMASVGGFNTSGFKTGLEKK